MRNHEAIISSFNDGFELWENACEFNQRQLDHFAKRSQLDNRNIVDDLVVFQLDPFKSEANYQGTMVSGLEKDHETMSELILTQLNAQEIDIIDFQDGVDVLYEANYGDTKLQLLESLWNAPVLKANGEITFNRNRMMFAIKPGKATDELLPAETKIARGLKIAESIIKNMNRAQFWVYLNYGHISENNPDKRNPVVFHDEAEYPQN